MKKKLSPDAVYELMQTIGLINVTKLSLNNSDVCRIGALHLANALTNNKTLTHLYLNSNKISNEGTIHLSSMIKSNKTLRTLEISSNGIGSVGLVSMASALKRNHSLSAIDLSNNPLTIPSFIVDPYRILSSMFLYNTSIKELKIHPLSNPILEQRLQRNITLGREFTTSEQAIKFLETAESIDPRVKETLKKSNPLSLRKLSLLSISGNQPTALKDLLTEGYSLLAAVKELTQEPDATIKSGGSNELRTHSIAEATRHR